MCDANCWRASSPTLEERVALASRLHDQAAANGQRLLAQTWSDRMHEYERELKVVRDGMQRMAQIGAQKEKEQAAQTAAE